MRAAWIGCAAIAISVAVSASAGCGGGLEGARAEPADHENDALLARQWHERVVRLENEAGLAAREGEACPARCDLAERACALAHRICELADRDDHDEGTRMLCEDAGPRCESARSAAGECGCGG